MERARSSVLDSSGVFALLTDTSGDSESESDREKESDGETGDGLVTTCPPELASTPLPELEMVSQ